MKLLVAVVLLACASTALAGYPFKPVYHPVCKKACKADYEECKDVVEEVCAPVKPVYYKHGRRLSEGKPKYECPKIKVTKKVCEKKPCTVTVEVPKTTCKKVCEDPKHVVYGRRLQAAYKPKYVAPAPKCEEKCETVLVKETKCIDKCVYDDCPKQPDYKPAHKPAPVMHKPAPDTHKPKLDIKDLVSDVLDKFKKHD